MVVVGGLAGGGRETLPERYNVRSELGKEVAPEGPAVTEQLLRFDLKGR